MAGRYPAGRCLRRTRLPRVPVHFGVDGIEEADELLMAMALHVLPISVSSIALDCCFDAIDHLALEPFVKATMQPRMVTSGSSSSIAFGRLLAQTLPSHMGILLDVAPGWSREPTRIDARGPSLDECPG